MSTVSILEILSLSSDDTYETGRQLGANCRGGEVLVLSSDLGGGKTVLAKGIAKGLGSSDAVTSPTFTITNTYQCRDEILMQHYDFYRLSEPGIMADEITEHLQDPKSVVVVEWGDIIEGVLPEERLDITISLVSDNEQHRKLKIRAPEEFTYLLEGIA